MYFAVHTQMVLHHKAVHIFFVAPCRLAHVSPETTDSVINRLLLICSPPVCNSGFCKIDNATISTPRPRHIVGLASRRIRHEISQTVGFFPLFFVRLRNDRVLRYYHFKSLSLQVGKHLFRILIITFPPFEILKILRPTNILIDNVARYATFSVAFCYFARQIFPRQHTPALSKTQSPFRRHDRLARQPHIMTDNFLIVLTEHKVIYHFTTRSFKAVILAAFRSKLKLRLIRIIEENSITVAAHKERNTLIQRIIGHTIARAVAVPHFIRLTSTVELASLFAQTEEMLVTSQHFIFHLLVSLTQPTVTIVAEKEFLVFVKNLKFQRRLIYPNSQRRRKNFIARSFLIDIYRTNIFQLFINDCKRRVRTLQLTIWRIPDTNH